MRNIPFFDTQNGVASLVLKEIPYTQSAYITVLDTQDLPALLEECVSFCRVVGAERIYAKGHEGLHVYPQHMQVLQMEANTDPWPQTDAVLESVTEETLSQWCEIYNHRMSGVDNAAYMSIFDGRKMLTSGEGYFVKQAGSPVAILMATEGKLSAVASVVPGGGRTALLALKKTFGWEWVSLEVASTNLRAISLYKSLGFTQNQVVSQWYKIL